MKTTRASIGAYEEGRATPNYQFLTQLAKLANISLDKILASSESKVKIGKTESAINSIPLVPMKAAAGYQRGFPDEEYIKELPQFSLPFLGRGDFRAFEIAGESMLPLMPGTIVIGERLMRLSEIKDGQTYVLVTKQDGIVYKRVFNYIRENGVLYLVSDNTRFKPYTIDPIEIHEVWSSKAYISIQFPETDIPSKVKLKKQLLTPGLFVQKKAQILENALWRGI